MKYFRVLFRLKSTYNRILCLLFILIFFSLPAFSQTQSHFNPTKAHYLWPTSASHALSSTFGETRAGHFHAALDIKTWGRRGYPVYATRRGILFRLAMGPRGYGNVIYLKHPDGSFSIYAHLMRFNKSIQHWADSLRFRHYTPSFDMIVDTLHIHIKQGEKIGISGASGIGPPHLHFELRTPENHPFNPLRTNLKVKDTRPPVFKGLAVEPLALKSTIEGRNYRFTKTVTRGRKAAHFGTIRTAGPVGLSLRVFDHANGVHNPYAVYKLQLQVDGRPVFQSKVDSFSYRRTHQMDIDRVYPLLQSTGRAYQRLYLADGNTLPFYQTHGDGGRVDLAPGRHKIVITASDFFGNTRKAILNLDVQKPFVKQMIYKSPDKREQAALLKPSQWTWFHNWVDIPKKQFKHLTIAPVFNPFPNSIFYNRGRAVAINLKHLKRLYISGRQDDYFIFRRVQPSRSSYLVSSDKHAYASFPRHCFYDTASVAIRTRNFAPDSSRITILPDNHPLQKSFRLYYKLPRKMEGDSTLSFYHYYARSDYLKKLDTQTTLEGLRAKPSSLGTFLILADHKAPRIFRPRVARRPDGQWLVFVSAKDNRSGLNYKKTRIYVNGVRGLATYQPEDDRLVYYRPHFKPQAKNSVKIVAYDRGGNKTVKKYTVHFSK